VNWDHACIDECSCDSEGAFQGGDYRLRTVEVSPTEAIALLNARLPVHDTDNDCVTEIRHWEDLDRPAQDQLTDEHGRAYPEQFAYRLDGDWWYLVKDDDHNIGYRLMADVHHMTKVTEEDIQAAIASIMAITQEEQ